MIDALPDLLTVRANWLALAVFGREQYTGQTELMLNGFPLSARSVALLFGDIGWLMTLFNTAE